MVQRQTATEFDVCDFLVFNILFVVNLQFSLCADVYAVCRLTPTLDMLCVSLVAVLLLVAGVDGCSMPAGWRPTTVEEAILDAEVVVYGEVWRTFAHDGGEPWQHTLYTAEVHVFCVLKGRRSEQIVNITDVGRSSCVYYSSLAFN